MHFLFPDGMRRSILRPRTLEQPYACMTVRLVKKLTLQLEPDRGVNVLKLGTKLVELPAAVVVLDPKGKPLRAEHQFFLTVDSIDPVHAICDIRRADQPR